MVITSLDPNITNDVLLTVQDILDRCQVRFFALKDTAKQIKETNHSIEPDLHLFTIELGIQKKDLGQMIVPNVKEQLKLAHIEPEWTDNYIKFTHKGVPVFIKIIQRKYQWFQNPDKKFYRVVEFNIPNPFDRYWPARFIIK